MSHMQRRIKRQRRFRGYPMWDDRQERIRLRRLEKEREAWLDLVEGIVWEYAALSGGDPRYRRVTGAYRTDGSPTALAQACEMLVHFKRAKVFLRDSLSVTIIKPDQPTQAEVMAELYGT